jgi:hypothetical protein
MKPTGLALMGAWASLGLGGLFIPCAAADAGEAAIAIVSGTYGSNCGAPRGNATGDLAQRCNGLLTCNYPVSVPAMQSGGCRYDYLAEWRCAGREFHDAALGPGARAGDHLVLSCVPSSGPGH